MDVVIHVFKSVWFVKNIKIRNWVNNLQGNKKLKNIAKNKVNSDHRILNHLQFKTPHRYRLLLLLQSLEVAFLSSSRWQIRKYVQIDPQTTKVWSIQQLWVSEYVKTTPNYREAELLNIATFPPNSINKYG